MTGFPGGGRGRGVPQYVIPGCVHRVSGQSGIGSVSLINFPPHTRPDI